MFVKENKLEHKSLEFYRGDQPNENLVGSFKAVEKKLKFCSILKGKSFFV